MLVAFLIALATVFYYRQLSQQPNAAAKPKAKAKSAPSRIATELAYADRLFKEKKYLLAEKAYLQAIKIDHKSAVAYTKLGAVYAKLRNYEDAKECLNMASQLDPSADTYRNLGLIYLESRNTIKAIAALEKAIMFESTPALYIDLSKAYQKLSNSPKTIESLQKAVELEPSKANLWLLAAAYKAAHDQPQAEAIYARILELDPLDTKASQALSEQTQALA